VWTEQTSMWWPADHTTAGTPGSSINFEPFVGGRVYERAADGAEHQWGEVVAWEPPRRMTYLWHIGNDRANATEVEITFASADDDRCRVDIEHRGWEKLGAGAADWRARNEGGWASLIPHFEAAASATIG
jgi:uncharacterized protein YndB with AHSA1/START domain